MARVGGVFLDVVDLERDAALHGLELSQRVGEPLVDKLLALFAFAGGAGGFCALERLGRPAAVGFADDVAGLQRLAIFGIAFDGFFQRADRFFVAALFEEQHAQARTASPSIPGSAARADSPSD